MIGGRIEDRWTGGPRGIEATCPAHVDHAAGQRRQGARGHGGGGYTTVRARGWSTVM